MPRKRDALVVIHADLAQQWATRINRHLGEAVEAILATGQELIAAKKALPHGGWERMFSGHPQAVKEPVSFEVSTAHRFMAIAKHPVLSNLAHVQDLPPSWGTLYELTKLEAPVLERAITDGRIHPAMERRDVTALRVDRAKAVTPWDWTQAGERLRRAVDTEFSRWGATDQDRPQIAYLLRQITKGFDEPS